MATETKNKSKRVSSKSVITKLAEISKIQKDVLKEQVIPKGLNPRQALYCIYYTQNDWLRGNGTLSYAEAYGYDLDSLSRQDAVWKGKGKKRKLVKECTYHRAYNVCAGESSRMLRNPKVQTYMFECLNQMLQDKITDARLSEIINQRNDLSTSLAGIREYNRLRGRIVDKKSLTDAEGKPLEIVGLVIHAPGTNDSK